jgi:hypothetical protein
MLLGSWEGWTPELDTVSLAICGFEVRTEASAGLQPVSSPAMRPARPREATLRRRRLVREAGRKGMS